MASSKETYCLCGQPYNIGQFMIECDCCREWFHGSCVDVKIYHSDDIDKYHCPKCAQTYGPSILKIPTNKHRADRYEIGSEARPSQVGTPAWVRALAARPLRPTAAALQRMRPSQFTEDFVKDNGFTRPVFFATPEGLDLKVPNSTTFTVRSVLRYCGAQLEVEVIDVRKQATLRMPLVDFVDYFETPMELRDEKVLNVLSLEVSDTSLSSLVEPPGLARRLDWAEVAWPTSEDRAPRPAVQKYCLMSAAGAYTDFHLDFGGTTVWYHVMHGRKIFYLIPPTDTNLALYQQWSASNNQNERFFGDMVEWYSTAELCSGQTLFIPSGWIHAVLTPRDSLVFGGNLLHSYAIETQLQIYEIERKVETPMMFRYPLFEAMHWYAGAHLLTMLRRYNEETQDEEFTISEMAASPPQQQLPPLLLRGIKILANALKEWHALKCTDSSKRDNVPKCLNSGQLVRELCKELRTLEKRSTTTTNKDKDPKQKSTSPNKSKKQNTQKKSLKLTLPKPIMHMGQNGEFIDEKVYNDRFYIDNKEVIYQDNRYVSQEVLPESKYFVETKDTVLPEKFEYTQPYEEPWQNYQDVNGFVDKKVNALKFKPSVSPSSSQEPPPPYPLPEHSILKSQLTRAQPRPAQWTISKKDIGDYTEEILYTNDNLHNVRMDEITYGPGMYSVEDVQPEFQPVQQYAQYQRRFDQIDINQQQSPQSHQYSELVTQDVITNNGYQQPPPAYATVATHYITEVSKPSLVPASGPAGVRRSERPVRRRVSNTYDYEDGDLYIDEAPPPRRKKAKHKIVQQASNSGTYRAPPRPAPANGIESLIQASVLAEEEDPPENTEDVAVAGMLSISERTYDANCGRTFGLATDTSHDKPTTTTPPSSGNKRARKPIRDVIEDEFIDEPDVIKEVHRDEEYVYPSLEMSSDEDEEWTSSKRRRTSRNRIDTRPKTEKDAAWSPRGRVGRLVPRSKVVRVPRHNHAVRAALTAAAVSDHHHHHHNHHQPPNAKRAVLATKSKRPPPPVQESPNKTDTRLKKGMKTAKQRLGKILKIHKMLY